MYLLESGPLLGVFAPALCHHVVEVPGARGRLGKHTGLGLAVHRLAVIPSTAILQDLLRGHVRERKLLAVGQHFPDRRCVGPYVSLTASLVLIKKKVP